MKNLILALIMLVGVGIGSAQAQAQAGPNSRVQFDQTAANVTEANGFTYRSYIDGGAGVVFAVNCVPTAITTEFVCTAVDPLPALQVGSHNISLSAANVVGESIPSNPYPFTVIIVPATPQNIRLVQ